MDGDSGSPQRIRSSTVLPAQRREVVLHTHDGLELVGELAVPEAAEPAGTVVAFHPLPGEGGSMDAHLFQKAAHRLPALAQLAVLRFNTRGTCSPRGCSQGAFGDGLAERADVVAAVQLVAEAGLPRPWLVGWSFGTELVLQHGLDLPGGLVAAGGILLSPPLRRSTDRHLDRWAEDGRPLTVLVPGRDHLLVPEAARRRFARVPQARLVVVEEARHLWVGERFVRIALDEIASTALGVPVSLPTHWDGPAESSRLR